MSRDVVLPFVTEAEYAGQVGAPRAVICEAERLEGGPPRVFPKDDLAFYGDAPLAGDFPAVTVTTLRDVVVRGKSNMLTAPDAVLRHGLFDPATEVTPEEFYMRLTMVAEPGSAIWTPGDPFKVGYVPEAAAFTDGVAFNYAHWMTEVLPRIAAFVRQGAPAGVPLIVDSGLHANIMRTIALIAGPDAVIHRLAPDALVRVGVLHNVSPTGYVPFKLRPQPVETICHGLFGPQALRGAVTALREAIGVPAPGGDRPRLFVRRNADLRRLINEPEIEAALTARGFVAVEPEGLGLDEQAQLFSRARMVVGATGAAMANVVFFPPDCPTVVLMPRFLHTAYWYWRRMAAAAGAGPVVHVSGAQAQATADPFDAQAVHQDFRIEVADVLQAVDAAEAASG